LSSGIDYVAPKDFPSGIIVTLKKVLKILKANLAA